MHAITCTIAAATLTVITTTAAAEKTDAQDGVERVATGFRFTEGPVAVGETAILFTDIPNEKIMRYHIATGEVTTERDHSGRSNGLMFDREGRLVMCEGGSRKLTRREADGTITTLAHRFGDKLLNSPNDLTLDDAGGIYFTDPRYGNRDDMQLDVEAVYYLPPGGGALKQVIRDRVRPNGIMLAPNGKTLYVVDNGAKTVWAYDVKGPGQLDNARLLAEMDSGGDGMTVDTDGRLYVTGRGRIWVFDPSGKLLRHIDVPESPANCTFGGPDRQWLYITARKSLYRIKLDARGAR